MYRKCVFVYKPLPDDGGKSWGRWPTLETPCIIFYCYDGGRLKWWIDSTTELNLANIFSH